MASFDFELIEGDFGQASPNQISPWIDPATIKLRHRIGRGPFGDLWLATHHQATEDYSEYHEVAIKMLHPIKEDNVKVVLDKFNDLFSKCQVLKFVCWLHGISIISGKICIVMKFYEDQLVTKWFRYGSRLGTPNYMAPEQWQPEVRGPISFETDSWGLLLKTRETTNSGGLPPAVENVIIGCFEYDLRSRPVMADILHAFKSSQNAVLQDGGWTGLTTRTIIDKSSGSGYTEWFLSKDQLQVGDIVRSRKPSNSCKHENMDLVHGIHDPIRVHGSTLKRVTFGLAAGIDAFEGGRQKPSRWVFFIRSIAMEPRKGGGEWATGRVCQILPNGCLVVRFPGRLTFGDETSSFLGDPAEMEVVSFSTCPDMIKKYQHLENFHWAVRPLLITLGLFTAMKLGLCWEENGKVKGKESETRL
ncbi:hypothetical protein LOK49_Contig590G00007 [Camellia lanceoleosa]|nr:hypothetical protein LOK49_Contig590G00007 [Camellia lanceoleosa]